MNYVKLSQIKFPKANNININMMPYIIGDKSSIPPKYNHYYDIINQCEQYLQKKKGLVGYISIMESFVEKGKSQRRGGIHVERHGNNGWGGGA